MILRVKYYRLNLFASGLKEKTVDMGISECGSIVIPAIIAIAK